ncbi:MAG TPA: tRNA (guanosine(46)-N7)-methyltransferase TrmB [Opitutaceae bacterium]|nr:tRNA (guanosine(46)-N7)-methyltransferase TrmB [Opitutaceae bacterium]
MNPITSPVPLSSRYATVIEERLHALRIQTDHIIPRRGPFVLEIGSGHGHFLTAYAAAHPKKICVGIDLVGERVARATRKRDRAALPNLHFVRADARLFLESLRADARIAAVFILFPDPWPKLRHHKHRILQPSFLETLARQATPECRLYFRTDFDPYFDEARAILAACPNWRLADEPWPFEFVTVFQQRAPSFRSFVARHIS